MFDPRNRLASEVSEQLAEHFAGPLYQTVIPRNVRLAEAPSHGLPVIHYDPSSRGSYAYMDLAAEILERHDQLSEHAVLEQATRPAAADEHDATHSEKDA
jgi:chromosome partitioning protein